ncbi:DUF1501 domain-containing protein [Ideonella sp. DXS22W]|uniref:DUF1501 domain-containing protein n=1 Tax=Pseudaquabacterium inlustre TaxID=2984192 RepID=A0ABU9CH10_9BURK
MNPQHLLSRRQWLRRVAGFGAALGGGAGASLLLPASSVQAADYRALVCVFQYGGNDGLNTIVPTDDARYAAYAAVRGELALPRERLIAVPGTDFGLHPALSSLATMFAERRAAPVWNVGPMRRRLDLAGLRAAILAGDASAVPDNLFSHSDQQVLWETAGASTLDRTGWGGRASQALATTWPVMAIGDAGLRFGLSSQSGAVVLPGPGTDLVPAGFSTADLATAAGAARRDALAAMYAAPGDSALADAFVAGQQQAFDMASGLASLVKVQPGQASALAAVDAAFAPLVANGGIQTSMGQQFYQVAKMVAASAGLGVRRQIFFTSQHGYDTHRGQIARGDVLAGDHARLLTEFGDAVAALHRAMAAIGLDGAVTTFTHSDFGRTFRPNRSLGTDHAWGNTQLVFGSSVLGGRGWGLHPQLQLAGPDDIDALATEPAGRWLPTTAVEEYVATLLRWCGADSSQLAQALPNLSAVSGSSPLGFLPA